jgi:hypothetical protein
MRAILYLLFAPALAAQTAPPVQFELKCAKSPCTFRMGEVIPLELCFTSRLPQHYQINTARYSNRDMEGVTFEVTPQEGVRDPLETYVLFGGTAGSMLMGFQYLSLQPVIVKVELNEYLRFDRPGTYQVQAASTRVSGTNLTSNQITLDIVAADPQWQQRELHRITQALDQPGHTNEPLIALRYLGTEGAARELARRLGAVDPQADQQCMLGLIGSPRAAAGLAAMDTLLRDADFPVTATFLQTMSYLALHPGDPLAEMQKQFDESMASHRAALLSALASKSGKGLAVSADTALGNLPPDSPESVRKMLSEQLRRCFDALPPNSQANWLRYRWDQIKDPAWIPVLQKIATAYEDFPQPREMHAFESLQTSGAALRRWYELDPAGARSAVIAEILRPKPRYGPEILGMLKGESLPEVETPLVERLAQTDDFEVEGHILALLERYGTGAALPELIATRSEQVGTGACDPQSHFLGYVLKFDPAAARPLIERALGARGERHNGCRHSLLMDLGAAHACPLLEEIALQSLNDSDPQVAVNAAAYLERYGSAAAEQALWTRYITWNREWTGREKELIISFGAEQNPNVWEANLGQALARALAQGLGWLSDDSKFQRILDLAVGDYVRSTVENARTRASDRTIQFIAGQLDEPGWYIVAQYDQLTPAELHKKLEQYPAGTEWKR